LLDDASFVTLCIVKETFETTGCEICVGKEEGGLS
jgi:hypothetical protein